MKLYRKIIPWILSATLLVNSGNFPVSVFASQIETESETTSEVETVDVDDNTDTGIGNDVEEMPEETDPSYTDEAEDGEDKEEETSSNDITSEDGQEETTTEASTGEEATTDQTEEEDSANDESALAAVDEEETQNLSEGLSWLESIFNSTTYGSTIDSTNKTIYIREAEGLILLSNVNAQEYQDWTITIVSSSGGSWDLTAAVTEESQSYSFQGLGTDSYPFNGRINYSEGGYGGTIQLNHSLFTAVYDSAALPSEGFILAAKESMSTPLFISSLKHQEDSTENDLGKIVLKGVTQSNDETLYNDFSGLIGTMEKDSIASMEVAVDDSSYSGGVTGSSHVGLFCNEMKEKASLTVKGYSGASLNVTSSGGNAGGFVGHMNNQARLIFSNSASITYNGTVKSSGNNFYAGGLVGYAENPDFNFSGELTLSGTVNGKVNSGGLVGYYLFSSAESSDQSTNQAGSKQIDLNNVNLDGVTLSGGNHTGGLFGEFYNTCSGTMEITDTSGNGIIKTTRGGSESSWQYGGLIGEYEVNNSNASLIIKNIRVNTTMSASTTAYGGLIGFLPSTDKDFTASYVEIDDVTVTFTVSKQPTSFGGLIGEVGNLGHMVNVGNVTLSGTYNASTDNGALIGRLTAGVVRLHGITDLTNTKASSVTKVTGQIVGTRDNALVYATGSGSDNLDSSSATDTGWMLKRSSSTQRVSDIGSYGEVVRLGSSLKEEKNAESQTELLNYNTTSHTVTVKEASETIRTVTDFAALALSIQLNNGKGLLALAGSTVGSGWLSKTITLEEDIDLAGTGITGLMRDNGVQTDSTQSTGFQGTFAGKNHTITLAIGEVYGFRGTTSVTEGDIGSGQIYNHSYLGLFARTGDGATMTDLILTGKIRFDLVSGGDKVLAGALIAQATGNQTGLALKNVEVKNPDDNTALMVYGGTGSGLGESGSIATASIAGVIGEGGTAYSSGNDKSDNPVKIQWNGCTWSSTLKNNCSAWEYYNGGFLAKVYGNGTEITVNNCKLAGTIQHNLSSKNNDSVMGGLVASMCRSTQSNTSSAVSTISIDTLTVSDTIKNVATKTTGGLLGYEWWNTNVSFKDVTISGSTLDAKSLFGGLVYKASGYWKVTKGTTAGIQFTGKNTLSGKTDNSTPSGLLVARGDDVNDTNKSLYLEIGEEAYKIENNDAASVTLSLGSYFDELVGRTINESSGNGVVSIATGTSSEGARDGIDMNSCNTYTPQLTKQYENPWTRYYYNVDSYRNPFNIEGIASADVKSTVDVTTIDSGKALLLWSLYFYAEENIRECFAKSGSSGYTIAGNIDLTGISYYPIDYPGATTISNATVVFANEAINEQEAAGYNYNENKKTDTTTRQHYLMHTGIFRNIDSDSTIQVNNLTLMGTIGKTKANTNGTSAIEGAGALICGTIQGATVGSTQSDTTLSIDTVTLDGITVYGMDDNTSYAPLLINQIGNHVKLNVSTVTTTKTYSDTEKKTTAKAATSLIGKAGSSSGAYISLSFSEMALDARTEQSTTELYGTYNTIFTRATFLESFQYSQGNASNCDGSYNFNSTDDKVTYGMEISNTEGGAVSGRNNGEQYYYYDEDIYVWDKSKSENNDNNEKNCSSYFKSGYLRYVSNSEQSEKGYWEIDINQRVYHLDEGCGTYGDPYLIKNGGQLSAMAAHLTGGANDWVIRIDPDVMEAQKETKSTYHTSDSDASNADIYLIKTSSGWKEAEKTTTGRYQAKSTGKTYKNDDVVTYLRNAYYMIAPTNQEDYSITLGGDSFAGIGGNDAAKTAFSGVIIGKESDKGTLPTIKINSPSGKVTQYGGLIKYSQGSVIKDLIVDYSEAEIKIESNSSQTKSEPNFWGGVIGYCIGGDSIIDNVEVKGMNEKIQISNTNCSLTPIGGYVGLVGGYGVSNSTSSSVSSAEFSKGGMVIFRNMSDKTDFETSSESISVNIVDDSGNNKSSVNLKEEADATEAKYYWNPYVGRVLDGAVFYDGQNSNNDYQSVTLNNTDKNYTIPTLKEETTTLSVNQWAENSYISANAPTITVQSPQQLWILSAISVSGAGAAEYSGIYWHDYSGNSANINYALQAYYYGKVRSGAYDQVGTATECPAEVVDDETSWGGVGYKVHTTTEEAGKVPYLIKKYTNSVSVSNNTTYKEYPARRITGSGKNFNLTIQGDCDMTNYGNGFRGIGAGYISYELGESGKGYYQRKTIDLQKVEGNNAVITLKRQVYEYENDIWNVSQAGLIPELLVHTNDATVSNLTLKGTVAINNTGSKTAIGLLVGAKKNSGDAKNKNVTFDHVTVAGTTEQKAKVSGGSYSGGIIGYVCYNKQLILKNCKAENVEITASARAGGLVGYIKDTGADKAHLFQECSYSDIEVTGEYAGGLVGECNRAMEVKGETSASKSIFQSGVLKATNHAGGVAGAISGTGTLENLEIKNLTASSGKNGGVGGAVSYSGSSLTASSVSVTEAHLYAEENSHVGGILGLSGNAGSITVDTCSVENSRFVSGRTAGGVLGQMTRPVQINNTSVTNNYIVVTKKYDESSNIKGAGALVSYLKGTSMKGYNILSNNNVIGYLVKDGTLDSNCSGIKADEADTIDYAKITENNVGLPIDSSSYIAYSAISSDTVLADNAKIGRWVGYCEGNLTIQLTGVSCQGSSIPTADMGYCSTETDANSYFVYADYTGSSKTKTETAVVTNPVSSVLTKEVMPEDITSDGASVIENTTNSIAQKIISDYNGKQTNEFGLLYRKIGDSVTAFGNSGSYAGSLTTYQQEENNQTTVDKSVDFPVLLVTSNITSDINDQINSYISLLTNQTDSQNYLTIKPTTYVWNSTNNKFQEAETATMVWKGNSLRINSGQYDNEKSQFTLLDVQYADPSDPTNSDKIVYHLYIPVLVKKVLNFDFYAAVKSGSSYLASDYLSADSRVIASHGDEITAYLTYEYDRTPAEWQSIIENGDNLLWNFSKEISLNIPDGTSVTLVDANNDNKAYYAITQKAYTGSDTFAFEEVFGTANNSNTSVTDQTNWSSVYLCDLLQLSAKESDTGTFVAENDVAKATVRVKTTEGYQYFRLADTTENPDDASAEKYQISVGLTENTVSENYFLTICTPTASAAAKTDNGTYVKISDGRGATDWVKNADGYDYYRMAEADDTGEKYSLTSSDVISFQINLPSTSPNKLKGQLPTQRKHTSANSAERNEKDENWYILGKFFNQKLEVKTLNGNAIISEEEPVLRAELTTTITLDTKSGTTFTQYAGDIPVYQGFSLQLYQYDSSGKATAVDIPKDAQINVTYSGIGTTTTKTYSSGDFLEYPIPADDPAIIQKGIVYGTVTLKAAIDIYYPSEAWTDQFPMRTESGDTTSGVEVSAQSKLSFNEDSLQNTSMSVTAVDSKEGDKHYYREKSKYATLNYNAVNSITTGDGTDGKDVSHLGVNANDSDRNLTMYTQGEYNIMNVVKKDEAKTLSYELQLYCKNQDGTYTEDSSNELLASSIASYWKNFSVYRNNTTLQNSNIKGTIALSDLGEYYDQTEEIIKIPIAFDALTGSAFEGDNRYYSNYKVVLKVELLDQDGKTVDGSECSDYIIYTNSAIYMDILPNTASSN